jgi:hypothetical protein
MKDLNDLSCPQISRVPRNMGTPSVACRIRLWHIVVLHAIFILAHTTHTNEVSN